MGRRCSGRSADSAGCFAPNFKGMNDPVLVSSVDGVGTKLKLAFAIDRHDTVGQDLVNHCVNDIAVLGARPLFFLDYIGAEKLEPPVFTQLIKGFAKACKEGGLRADRRRDGADAGHVSARRIRSRRHDRRRGGSPEDARRLADQAGRRDHRPRLERPAHERLLARAQGSLRADETHACSRSSPAWRRRSATNCCACIATTSRCSRACPRAW